MVLLMTRRGNQISVPRSERREEWFVVWHKRLHHPTAEDFLLRVCVWECLHLMVNPMR